MWCLGRRGAGPGCNSLEISERLLQLKDEIEHLDRRERELDQHKSWVQQSIKNVTDDIGNHQYPSACSNLMCHFLFVTSQFTARLCRAQCEE